MRNFNETSTMTSSRVRALVLALFFSSCCIATDAPEFLSMSFEEFDQSPQGGWRKLAQSGKCTAAAQAIERYAEVNADKLTAYEKFSLAFHAGQMYGLADSKDAAVQSLQHALKMLPNSPNDAYLKALISFSRNDANGLVSAKAAVAALDDSNPAKATQVKAVFDLIAYLGCPLAVVGRPRQTVNECPANPTPCD